MNRARSVSRTAHHPLLETLRAAVVLAALSLALAVSAASAVTLPPGWSHAQVNVMINHEAHTLIYDRGVITQVSRKSLTLKERDSSVVVIRVARSAVVTLGSRPIALTQLRPGEFAQTVRVDGAAARQVRARRLVAVG